MTYSELLQIFCYGLVFGVGLSVIPFVIGEAASFVFKIMKGGF